jgi:hypothetical protein
MKKLLLLSLGILFATQVNSQNPWQPLSTGLNLSTGALGKAFTIYNNKLVAGGLFNSAGGNATDNIASWDGSNWSTFSTGLQGTRPGFNGLYYSQAPCVNAVTVFQGNLIAGGYFATANTTTLNCLAKWNGSSWSSIANNLRATSWNLQPQGQGQIFSLTVYNNKLIAAGRFDTINGVAAKNIAQWDGTSWSPLGTGIAMTYSNSYYDKQVSALTVFNNELYAGGSFSFTATGNIIANNIAKWNGTTWSAVGTGIPNCSNPSSSNGGGVSSLAVYNTNLYAGNCITGISKWDGSNWAAVGGGLPNYGVAYSMTVFDNKLVIGGDFFYTGIYTAGCIAAWDGSNWLFIGKHPVNIGMNGICTPNLSVNAVVAYSAQLYACGLFQNSVANTTLIPLNKIARFANATIGIEEYSNSNPIKISPNPSTGQFTFEGLTGNSSIEVTDLAGRIIYTGQMDESKNFINMQGMNSGLYLFKLRNKQNQIQQGKLILE